MVPVLTRPSPRRRPLVGPAGILPTDVANLTLWLKADAGTHGVFGGGSPVTTDGSAVGGWFDQGGAGHHFGGSDTGRPTLKTAANGINGLPVLRFDNVDDRLSSGTAATFGLGDLITTTEFCIYLVARPGTPDLDSGTTYNNEALISESGGNWGLYGRATGPTMIAYNYEGGEDIIPLVYTAGTVYGIRWRHTGGNMTLRRSGLAEGSVASGVTVLGANVNLGSGYAPGAYAGGDLAEIFIYNAQPTTDQLTGLDAYLAGRYGIVW